MNVTNFDIQSWAKEASIEYLQNSVPLNDGIEKIARTNNLNPHQVDRLVERANGMTYVALANSSKNNDRYVEFPVADTRKISSNLDFHETGTDELSDYREPPEKTAAKEIDLSEIFPGVEDALENELTDKDKRMIKKAAVESLEQVNTTKREIAVVFDIESDKFIDNVKQASLHPNVGFYTVNGHFDSLDDAVKSVLLPLIKEAGNRVPNNYKNVSRTVEEDYDFSELEKQGAELIKIIKAYKQLDECSTEIVKTAVIAEISRAAIRNGAVKGPGLFNRMSSKIFKTVGDVAHKATKSRLAMAGLIGVPIVGGTTVGAAAYKLGKEKTEQNLSPMKTIPEQYNKWRA